MEKSLDYFGFEIIESFFAYHCFGNKATEILSSIDQPYKDIPHKNIRALMVGLELQDYKTDKAKEDVDALNSFFDQLPDSVLVKWQISHDFGNPHVEYIAWFDTDPVCGATHS